METPEHCESQLQSVTRRWPRLKVIKVFCKAEQVLCIVDGVERGMFPSLTTMNAVNTGNISSSLFRLYRANIYVVDIE